MKAALYPEAERVSVSGPDAFYAYCALTVYGSPSVAGKVKAELWDSFDTSADIRAWAADIDSGEYRKVAPAHFPPLDVLIALAVQVYSLEIRVYSARYANTGGYRDYAPSVGRRSVSMTLELGEKGELYLLVAHDARTGRNKIPTTVINVLAPAPSSSAGKQSESPFSLAVYDSQSRTHMKMGARFIPPGRDGVNRAHYMNFDLDMSAIKPSWQFILKGCDAHPVFIFAMRTEAGVRHASYIAHWPVAMVEPYITLSKKRGDDGLIVVPVESNSLDEAKRCVVVELKCIIDA